MRLSIAAGIFAAIAITFVSLQTGYARERGPRVEVVCPMPPTPVELGGKQVLVYELHLTNFDVVPLTLKRVEVFADTEKGQPLTIVSGDALPAIMADPGALSASKDAIGPAKRIVIFLWVELGSEEQRPQSLEHRLVFAVDAAGTEPKETTLEDFSVPVRHEAAVVLIPPFDSGVWLAGDGPGNDSAHRRSVTAIDGQVHIAQRFAIDWQKIGPNGDTHHDGTDRNENFWGYGEPVLAVADGEVTQVLDGIPENTPRVLPQKVTLDNIAGNYIILRIAPNLYVSYAHLQTGSIKVHVHDRVSRGTVIAHLGNTGQATAPHLHLQVTDGDSVLQSEGVPFVFPEFDDLGSGATYELDKHPSIPRTNAIPGKDEVVEFRGTGK